jgi:hypothetical protein
VSADAATHSRSSCELLHLVSEAGAFFADQVSPRHSHVIEIDFRRVGGMHADLVDLARHGEALSRHRHAAQRFIAMRRAFAGIGKKTNPVGLGAVGYPHLAAVDHIVIAVRPSVGADRGDIRAGTGFGYAEASDVLARYRRQNRAWPRRCHAAQAGVAMSVCTPIAIGIAP